MNTIERLNAQIKKLEEEKQQLQVQKDALNKVAMKYQVVMGQVELSLSNWQQILKMFEQTCEEKGIQISLTTQLEFNLTGKAPVPMTYTMVIAQIETLEGIKKSITGEMNNGN